MGLKSLGRNRISWVRAFASFGLLMVASPALATMTFLGVTSTAVSSTDLTDLTKPIIFGGIAGTCSPDANNAATCDSCTGGITACSKTNIYGALKIPITLQTATSGFTAANFYIQVGAGSKVSSFVNVPTLGNDGTLNTLVTWGEICSVLGGDTNCSTGVNGEVTFGLSNGTATDSIAITFRTRVADTTADTNYTDCDAGTGTGGACHFKALRGDAKIYADDLVFISGYPTSTVSGIPFKDVLIFYETKDAATASDDTALINALSNKSPYTAFSALASANPPISDNRVTGLKNDQRYCTLMANRDAAGIISFFTPQTHLVADEVCATPTKVVGLLDDKSCFIATAAFGSSMAPQVESFRQFRNHFLLTNPVGKAFVRTYYKYSPYYANLIAESEMAKAVVRAALWPLLLFARLTLVFGFWIAAALTALSIWGLIEVYRRFFIGRQVRGES